ncbi:hypothetical protein JTB14_027646 [Gonioctena quinquepunctata]|nr:hypothetical protein JTB14_027646 [Gonioctena quinquepunctata]
MSTKGGTGCAFRGCSSRTIAKNFSFFRFPKDVERAQNWIEACKRDNLGNLKPEALHKSYCVNSTSLNLCLPRKATLKVSASQSTATSLSSSSMPEIIVNDPNTSRAQASTITSSVSDPLTIIVDSREQEGTVPDLLLSLEAFLKEKYPDLKNTSDFDFSNVLEEIDKEVSDENKGLEQKLEFISNKVKNLEFLCIHLSEKLKEHDARFEQIENSLEELKKKYCSVPASEKFVWETEYLMIIVKK